MARRPKGFFHSFPLEVRQKGYVGVTHQAKEGEIGRTCRWFLFPGWYISASSLIPQTSKVICHVGHSSLFFPLSNIFPPLLQLAQFFFTPTTHCNKYTRQSETLFFYSTLTTGHAKKGDVKIFLRIECPNIIILQNQLCYSLFLYCRTSS